MTLDIEKLQKRIAQCINGNCPSAEKCVRQIVRKQCSRSLEQIRIVNPDAITMTDGKCQFYKGSEGVAFGKGFNGYFDTLTVPQERTARAVLHAYFHNRTQFSRYRSGTLLLSPKRLEEVNALLAHHMLPPLVLDDMVVDIE